jgi:hypothetical protein
VPEEPGVKVRYEGETPRVSPCVGVAVTVI